MNKIAPFTERQVDYLRKCLASWFNVAEGGKRGGKNVLQTMAFCIALEYHPNRLHLVSGVSITTAKLNIIDCDGYGMSNYFEGRCREGKYKERSCLYINTVTGEKVVMISGGGKKGDEKLIKGNTYGMAYITEANECAEDFIREVFDRTLSSDDRKIFHDLNPKAPEHWYYKNVLDIHEGLQADDPNYGYNYGHFTIADNLSVSDEKLKKNLSTYDKNSIWYKRDIKGLRIQAEGLVYEYFANNSEKFMIKKKDLPARFASINIGHDFGGNKSNHAFVASGIGLNNHLYKLRAKSIKATGMSFDQLQKEFVSFVEGIIKDYGYPNGVYCDSAEQTMINSYRSNTPYPIYNSIKKPINDRIRCTLLLMGGERYHIVEGECDALVNGLKTAVWDSKSLEDKRLDDGTSDIDILDADEYSFEYNIYRLVGDR